MNDIPKSLKIGLAMATIAIPLLTVVGNYAMYGYRIEQLEIRVTNDEQTQRQNQDSYRTWQQQISTDVATTRTNVEWIRQAMQKRP